MSLHYIQMHFTWCRTIVFVAYEECDMASNLSKETHVSVGVCFYMLQQQMTLKIAVVQISIFLFHSFCDHWRPSCCLSNHHLRISSQQRKRFRQHVKLSVKDSALEVPFITPVDNSSVQWWQQYVLLTI